MKIIFMGTPEFAVSILNELHQSHHEILCAVTVADKPAGRGQTLSESAVKKYCVQHNISVLQPLKLKDEEFLAQLKKYDADLFVVVAFRMLPEVVWKIPPQGTINLHASLLPKYRGAAPINWAIINGEKKTGVSTFFINEKIDTGDVILQNEVYIDDQMNAGELHNTLMKMGATTTLQTVNSIEAKSFSKFKQIENLESTGSMPIAPKIFKEDCRIDWDLDCNTVHNFIRGLSPYPGAWCTLYNHKKNLKATFKIFDSIPIQDSYDTLMDIPQGIVFPCKTGAIRVTRLQQEGKRHMTFKEFLAGNNLNDWGIKNQY